jgi:hypothetical protein
MSELILIICINIDYIINKTLIHLMGQFNERSPLGKKEKRGRLSPGPGRHGLGFLGGGWPGPTLAGHRLAPPIGRRPWLPWWRGKVHPLPTI